MGLVVILFFIHRRISSDKMFCEFFYILVIKEIAKIMENVQKYKRRERV